MKGLNEIELIQTSIVKSRKAFVALWFTEEIFDAYNQALAPAITACGYECNHVGEILFNEKICDEIISQIKASKFIVADFSGHRGGVYFEAGFAMGLGIPVIFTCRKDWFNAIREEETTIITVSGDSYIGMRSFKAIPHFDVDHYNFIVWSDHDDLKSKLADRISATIGVRI